MALSQESLLWSQNRPHFGPHFVSTFPSQFSPEKLVFCVTMWVMPASVLEHTFFGAIRIRGEELPHWSPQLSPLKTETMPYYMPPKIYWINERGKKKLIIRNFAIKIQGSNHSSAISSLTIYFTSLHFSFHTYKTEWTTTSIFQGIKGHT